jgi:hypothetical protein
VASATPVSLNTCCISLAILTSAFLAMDEISLPARTGTMGRHISATPCLYSGKRQGLFIALPLPPCCPYPGLFTLSLFPLFALDRATGCLREEQGRKGRKENKGKAFTSGCWSDLSAL